MVAVCWSPAVGKNGDLRDFAERRGSRVVHMYAERALGQSDIAAARSSGAFD
jgi:hypothetical protein